MKFSCLFFYFKFVWELYRCTLRSFVTEDRNARLAVLEVLYTRKRKQEVRLGVLSRAREREAKRKS